MNLYMVEPNKDSDWGLYVYAPSVGKAKARFYSVRGLYSADHIAYNDIRAYLLRKDVD